MPTVLYLFNRVILECSDDKGVWFCLKALKESIKLCFLDCFVCIILAIKVQGKDTRCFPFALPIFHKIMHVY